MSEHVKTMSALNSELQQIDIELRQIAEQEREAEHGIGELSLQARRGDKEAASKLDQFDKFSAEVMATRRRLKAARSSVEAELQTALVLERTEETKSKAREAQKILATFSKRGAAIEAGLRKVLADYAGIQADMATLSDLGMTKVNPELVKANCRRAFRAALIPIRTDLEMTLVPPLERRGFSDLVAAWSGNVEQTIRTILKDDPQEAPASAPAQSVAAVKRERDATQTR